MRGAEGTPAGAAGSQDDLVGAMGSWGLLCAEQPRGVGLWDAISDTS